MSHNCSTVAAVAGSASSAEPASIPLTMHLHGHPLPACKPLDIFYRPQEWPHNFKPEDHHRGDDTTLDLFLLSLSRPVLVFAYPAGPGGPMRSAEAAGATKTMSSLAKSKNECEEPSRSIESGVEATLRIIGETLEQLRRQEPHLEVFGMSAATEARRSNAADLGSRLGLTVSLVCLHHDRRGCRWLRTHALQITQHPLRAATDTSPRIRTLPLPDCQVPTAGRPRFDLWPVATST